MLPINRKEETNKYYQRGCPNKNQIEGLWGLEPLHPELPQLPSTTKEVIRGMTNHSDSFKHYDAAASPSYVCDYLGSPEPYLLLLEPMLHSMTWCVKRRSPSDDYIVQGEHYIL